MTNTGNVGRCLTIDDLSIEDVRRVLRLSTVPVSELGRPLEGRGAALIFEKPSNRTRQSMEMAVYQLGGHPIYTRGEEVGFDEREPVEDIARILDGYHGLIAARVFDHRTVERLAVASSVPVINMLSDVAHPLQGLADALTMQQHLGDLAGTRVAYVGDYNNVARSLAEVSIMLGAHVALGCPPGFDASVNELERLVGLGPGDVVQTRHAAEAVADADAVHTDTWVSMGQEADKAARIEAFAGFRVDESLLSRAKNDAIFMHCLPAYRGVEVSEAVIDGPQSVVFQQGHNRLHTARGLIAFLTPATPPTQ